jgi:glyoxylase-like metal-dependent hydrolase (beta-lactamase superfamily II)
MKEILPGVYTWSHFSEEKKIDFNGWLIAGPDDSVIVDPPPISDADMDQLAGIAQPKAIALTNKDHVRASEQFASRFRVPVIIHQADAPLANGRIGGLFKSDEHLPGGLRVIRVPDGKSPGECCFLIRHASALLVGDAFIGKPAGKVSMLPAEKFADAARALAGLRSLLDFPFESLLLGDGEPIIDGGRAALEQFLKSTGS